MADGLNALQMGMETPPKRKRNDDDGSGINFKEFIAHGGFGFVFKVTEGHSPDPVQTFALKICFPTPKIVRTSSQPEVKPFCFETQTQRELLIQGKTHPNVVQTLASYPKTFSAQDLNKILKSVKIPNFVSKEMQSRRVRCTGRSFCIKMELCGKNLGQWILNKQHPKVTEISSQLADMQTSIVEGVVEGLKFLHGNKILHRDLKPGNIYFAQGFKLPVKIGDFGLCRHIHSDESKTADLTSKRGTLTYRAPEVNAGKEYTFQADLFSLGLVIWEVLQFVETTQFPKLFQDGQVELVERHPKVINSKDLIISLTKSNIEERLQSVEDIVVKHARVVGNEENLRKALEEVEEGGVIELADGEYHGGFVLKMDNVLIKGSSKQSSAVIVVGDEIGLDIKGHNCEVFNLKFCSSTKNEGQAMLVVARGNKIYDIRFENLTLGIEMGFGCHNTGMASLQFRNVVTGIKMSSLGSNEKVSDVDYELTNNYDGNDYRDPDISYFGVYTWWNSESTLEGIRGKGTFRSDKDFLIYTDDHSQSITITDCSGGPIVLGGADHILNQVYLCPFIGVKGTGHRLHNFETRNFDDQGRNTTIGVNCKFNTEEKDTTSDLNAGAKPIQNLSKVLPSSFAKGDGSADNAEKAKPIQNLSKVLPSSFAKGDGSADNAEKAKLATTSEELRMHLANAEEGDTIHLLQGVYQGPLSLNKNNLTLEGVGKNTVIQSIGEGLVCEQNGCKISGIRVVGSSSNTGISIRGNNNKLLNLIVEKYDHGISVTGYDNNLDLIRCENIEVNGIAIHGSGNSIFNLFCVNTETAVNARGNGNAISKVIYSKDNDLRDISGVVIIHGRNNSISRVYCSERDKRYYDDGIHIWHNTANTQIENCDCSSVKIEGKDHKQSNVIADEGIKILGSGHHLTHCLSNDWDHRGVNVRIEKSNYVAERTPSLNVTLSD